MKVLHKKRIDRLKLSFAWILAENSLFKHQLLWYSAAIAVYGWFMFWIAYDFFVWHKPLIQGNVINFIGAAASVAFIWAEAKLFKTKRQNQTITPKKKPKTQQKPKLSKHVASQETQTTQTNPFKCEHFENPQNPDRTPDECLTCTNLLQCRSNKKPSTNN